MEISSIVSAIKQICTEKNIPYETVVQTIEAALAAAYRKDFGQKNQNIKAQFDLVSGQLLISDVKAVVDDKLAEEFEKERAEREKVAEEGQEREKKEEPIFDTMEQESELDEDGRPLKFSPKLHITFSDAKDIKPDVAIGDEIKIQLNIPADFGRMAAQTAKQVIIQRLREAEREVIFNDFKDKENTVLMGSVQKMEGRNVLVDLGKITAIMPQEEQVQRERYRTGDRLKVFVKSVNIGSRGPEVIVSRTHPRIVHELFVTEIPEIINGSIEIKGVSRDAGFRSKIAVFTEYENIDPIGSCVGQRGTRVQTIIGALGGEKIDIIEYNDSPEIFVANALLPAKIQGIKINAEEKMATVTVNPEQLSLAIGKDGQNVRLAAQLTGWRINIIESITSKVVASESIPETCENKIIPEEKSLEEVSLNKEEKESDEKVQELKEEKPKKTRKPRTKKIKKDSDEVNEEITE